MKLVQWFPGHMNKTRRLITEQLGRMDVIIEILDARIPYCSRNPMIAALTEGKKRLIVLNKTDMADVKLVRKWQAIYKAEEDYDCVVVSSTNKKGLILITKACRELCKNETWIDRRPVRALVGGIPNVGKSTLINALAGTKKAIVGNKPGVTRDLQRIKINPKLEFVDTPGLLWPKFDNQEVGIRLAVLGSIKDSILHLDELTAEAVRLLIQLYPDYLKQRYKIEVDKDSEPYTTIEAIGKKRGCLVSGGKIDMDKASGIILTELRQGKLGPITFDRPDEAFMINEETEEIQEEEL